MIRPGTYKKSAVPMLREYSKSFNVQIFSRMSKQLWLDLKLLYIIICTYLSLGGAHSFYTGDFRGKYVCACNQTINGSVIFFII